MSITCGFLCVQVQRYYPASALTLMWIKPIRAGYFTIQPMPIFP